MLRLFLLSLIFIASSAHGQPCLKYDPAVVRLTGVIKLRKAADVNLNEDHDPKGKWNTYYALHLAQPICMDADSDALAGNGYNDTISNVRDIELVNMFPEARMASAFKQWKSLARSGKHVIVTGKLYHADNGNQYTDVLIEVRDPIELKR